ncbi:hypothetical protein [Nocardiopsis synnemataformans]|uniref:hypothetical protein n=1 Tax=Nocardiopsis synnemataformans TaxID=61305 RepID=UPI003EBC4E10
MSATSTPQPQPTVALLADVFAVLDAHGYERAAGRTLGAALPHLGELLADLTATYEGRVLAAGEVPGA